MRFFLPTLFSCYSLCNNELDYPKHSFLLMLFIKIKYKRLLALHLLNNHVVQLLNYYLLNDDAKIEHYFLKNIK